LGASRTISQRFFSIRTLERPGFLEFLPYPRVQRKLPVILSKEETTCLINSLRRFVSPHAADGPLWHGMRRSEVARLKIVPSVSARTSLCLLQMSRNQSARVGFPAVGGLR
jgi:integrase